MPSSKKTPTLDEAMAYFQKGSFGRAESACRKILRRDRQSVGAFFLLALIHQEQGESSQAVEDYQRVISINPDVPEAHYNLGVLLYALGKHQAAIKSLREAVLQKPQWPDAHNNLGIALLDAGNAQQAGESFRQAIELDENNAAAWLNLGSSIIKSCTPQVAGESLDLFRKAVELNPEEGQAHQNLGVVLEGIGSKEEAIACYQRAVELQPEQEMWKFYLDIKSEGSQTESVPANYIANLFDSYADKFDEHLVGRLQYSVPQLLFEAVQECGRIDSIDLLDLGCGTGLCGELFQPISRSMTGVDLAPKMIDVAKSKNIYTNLAVSEINEFMHQHPGAYDVILAADVFIYVGDLEQTFRSALQALRPGGLFAFSVESCEGDGFELDQTRRFRHSLGYLKNLAMQHGFVERSAREVALRKQAGIGVPGNVVVLEKPAS